MANIMSMRNVRNKVHRNGFDLSFRNSYTAKVGELLPVMVEEVIPGDRFDIKVQSFMRTQPLNSATFTRMRQYYDFYFVPLRLLWDKFPSFITQTGNPTHALSIFNSAKIDKHPWFSLKDLIDLLIYLRQNNNSTSMMVDFPNYGKILNPLLFDVGGMCRYHQWCKLLNYLGYGDLFTTIETEAANSTDGNHPTNPLSDLNDVALNPFPILAYQKIYQDYFRFQQWEKPAPYTCNLDYIMGSPTTGAGLSNVVDNSRILLGLLLNQFQGKHGSAATPCMFDMRYANYKKDLFMGVLPSPQFGDTAVASPLSGSIAFENFHFTDAPAANDNSDVVGTIGSQNSAGSTTAGLSIFALRQAEFLQKWKEITQSGNLDYREQLEKHWNVKTSRFQSDLCDYIGGFAANIDINEVTNTNLAEADYSANLFGKGLGSASGGVSREFNEHGILMCIYHVEPVLDYFSIGLDRLNTKVTADAYAIPEFDSLGMEPLPMQDIIFTNVNDLNGYNNILSDSQTADPIGYVPRYIEYKTARDMVRGAFMDSMSHWVSPLDSTSILDRILAMRYDYNKGDAVGVSTSDIMLTPYAFKIKPSVVNPIFVPQAGPVPDSKVSPYEADVFLNAAYFDVKAVRNLSADGLPY